jgi:hypothetical protein
MSSEAPAPEAPAPPEAPVPPEAPAPPERCNILLLSFAAFYTICFGVWLFSAGNRYREEYAQATDGWHVGSSRSVELTVVQEDKQNLACLSDRIFWGLHCGGMRDLKGADPDPRMLQPYNTTSSQLLLGAGLWNSPELKQPLPRVRFTVVCNYHIKGIVKSAKIRFGPPTSPFTALGSSVTAGTFTDCVLPR